MIAAGYHSGVVTKNTSCNCECESKWLLKEMAGSSLDPINLEEEFQEEGLRIWFRMRPLRMMNRCQGSGASPVSISDAQKDTGNNEPKVDDEAPKPATGRVGATYVGTATAHHVASPFSKKK